MRLFTGRGDDGTTDLLGARVTKDDPRIETIGALDEATSAMGLGRALATTERVRDLLTMAQRDLYQVMAELAFTDELRPDRFVFAAERVVDLNTATDALTEELHLPPHFVLPGDTPASGALDLARAVVRRAERRAVALHHEGHLESAAIMQYLNRLSSLLFALARWEDQAAGKSSTPAKAPE